MKWLIRKTKSYKAQQEQIHLLKNRLQDIEKKLLQEKKWNNKFNVFADNIHHILSDRTNGTQLYFLPKLTFVLITSCSDNSNTEFLAYAPFISSTEIGAAYVNAGEQEYLYIRDLWVDKKNRGNGVGGSLLKEIIEEAQRRQVKKITGQLGRANSDEFEKLERFYAKYGFAAKINEDRTSGNVELVLNHE